MECSRLRDFARLMKISRQNSSHLNLHVPLRAGGKVGPLLLLLLGVQQPLWGEGPYFENVTSEAGINHVHGRPDSSETDALSPVEQEAFYLTGGAAAGDFNNDGWIDLFFPRINGTDILYLNNQDGTFSDVSASFGFTENYWSNGAVWADIDNDHDLDLYVTTLENRNLLYVNTGSGFVESAILRNTGASLNDSSIRSVFSASFGDFNCDGYLDLYTTNWGFIEANPTAGSSASRLYQNQGAKNPGFFEDVTVRAGVALESPTQAVEARDFVTSFTSSFVDVNNDGLPDLAVASDFGDSRIYHNNDDGTFTNITEEAGVGIETNAMGSTFGDFDNDGDQDWLVTSIFWERDEEEFLWGDPEVGNRLYENNGDGTFTDITDTAGVANGGWGWGTDFVDYNNDGLLDIVMTNGIELPFTVGGSGVNSLTDESVLFENNGDGTFSRVDSAISGITDQGQGRGLLTLDYDNDGDSDLVIVNNEGAPILYQNQHSEHSDSIDFFSVDLEGNGVTDATDAIGARVKIIIDVKRSEETTLWREVNGFNFLGQSDREIIFGLDGFDSERSTIDLVEIYWLSGRVDSFQKVSFERPLSVSQSIPEPSVLSFSLLALFMLSRRQRAPGNLA